MTKLCRCRYTDTCLDQSEVQLLGLCLEPRIMRSEFAEKFVGKQGGTQFG